MADRLLILVTARPTISTRSVQFSCRQVHLWQPLVQLYHSLSSSSHRHHHAAKHTLLAFKRQSTFHDSVRQVSRATANILLGKRVKEALANGSPIVALESTVITHGLPEPENLRLALSLEEKIANCMNRKKLFRAGEESTTISDSRSGSNFLIEEEEEEEEVTPATIGIVKGQIIVGLSGEEIEYLAHKEESKPIKASRRDIPIATALGLSAGTTVSATMAIASSVLRTSTKLLKRPQSSFWPHSHLNEAWPAQGARSSAIKVFATGGTGGVHLGGENSMDISADLFEFAKSPIGVVSSGFKSFLDTRRSLEYLETMGCTVISLHDHYSDHKTDILSEESFVDENELLKERQQQQHVLNIDDGGDYGGVVEGKCFSKEIFAPGRRSSMAANAIEGTRIGDDQSHLFPGFYSRTNSQKVKSPCLVRSIEEAGKILFDCLEAPLLDRRGFLLAVPVPKMFSINAEQAATLLSNISQEIDKRSDIEGKEKTPMMLERFARQTEGKSLKANIELLKNNAQVGALLALEYSRLQNRTGK